MTIALSAAAVSKSRAPNAYASAINGSAGSPTITCVCVFACDHFGRYPLCSASATSEDAMSDAVCGASIAISGIWVR